MSLLHKFWEASIYFINSRLSNLSNADISALIVLAGIVSVFIILFAVFRMKKKKVCKKKYSDIESMQGTFLQARFSFIKNNAEDEALDILYQAFEIVKQAAAKTNGILTYTVDGSFSIIWGGRLSTGSMAHDALNAVRAALLMRMELLNFNLNREQKKNALILNMGISSGKINVGFYQTNKHNDTFMWSETVQHAFKAREAADRHDIDIVITAKTWRLVKSYIITEELQALGETKDTSAVRLFAAINLCPSDGTHPKSPLTRIELQKLLNYRK